jgi:glycosyltransferase 2 family protein
VHLIVGSPRGLSSAAEVADGVAELNVAVDGSSRAPHQAWGAERFTGRGAAGDVYGRDAADARVLAKLWRFCFYRDSGPTLILDRLQQVEHEAYMTFMVGRAGVLVPEVLAAGRFGPSRDAAFVVRDFRRASSSARASRLDDDLAAVLAALAVRFGVERASAAASRALDAASARGAQVHLQRSALDPGTIAALRQRKGLLPQLRREVALAAGIEVPKLADPKRISWVNLVFGIGSLIGIWAILGVLADGAGSLDVLKGAAWGWVSLAFLFAQLPIASNALALVGAVTGQIPFGRCLALETSNEFTQFVGGDIAAFAVRVRFFQRQGYDPAAALSSGAIASTASWAAKGILFLISISFAAGSFEGPGRPGGRHQAIWVVVGLVLAAGVAVALISLIPRLRRLASARIRPRLVQMWADVKAIVGGAVPVPGGAGVIEAGLIAGLTMLGCGCFISLERFGYGRD